MLTPTPTIESLLKEIITKAVSSEFSRVIETWRPYQGHQENLPEILDVKEAATLLNLATSTIYGLVHKAKIPHIKKGKKLRFKRAQLLRWIDSGEKEEIASAMHSIGLYTRKPSK